MTKIAETCVCGAQFSIDDSFHSAEYVYKELAKWQKDHPCPLRHKSDKKHTLEEHERDVWEWWYATHDGVFKREPLEQRLFFIAYERWINNKPLLAQENIKVA